MSDKKVKRIAIYPLLSSGHTNVCVTIAKVLLNDYPEQVEITFVTDNKWKEKLSKLDCRFNFRTFEYDDIEQSEHVDKLMAFLEPITKLPLVERMGKLWISLDHARKDNLSIDRKCGDILADLKPDFLLIDQVILPPAVIRANCPYAFIISANPLSLDLSDDYPMTGSDARMDDKAKILEFRKGFEPYLKHLKESSRKSFTEMGVKIDDDVVTHKPYSKHFTIYCFPKELDYFSDAVKKENKLISFDTPLIQERLPVEKFELPENFKGHKVLYVSLGSMFSVYSHLVQRLVDILDTLPYRYIVSKGPKGHLINFPSDKFIGENYVNQLAVLQVVDAMIAHGGNNTLGECAYFGVPSIILPVFVDQIQNGTRIEELGYGYSHPIYEYTDDQLKESVEKILNDDNIREKWKSMSDRIRKDKNHHEAIKYIFDYI